KTRNCSRPLFEIAEITFAPKRWPVALDERRLSDRRPGAAGRVVGAQAHLVGPQDQRPLAVGAPLQLRVALIQPARYQLWILLERAPRRLLRTEPPRAQVTTGRLLTDTHPEATLDQLADQRPRPQEPRQPQLIGILVANRLRDLRLLPGPKRGLLTRPPAPPARRQRPLAAH